MFLLGSFVIVASILRLALLFNEDLNDPTWGLVNAFTWSNIEVDIAVLSACLPTLRPIFQKLWPSLIKTHGASNGLDYSSDNYSKLAPKGLSGEEFARLPKAVSHDNSIYASNNEGNMGRDGYMMKGITVQREFSTMSGEVEV